MKKSLLLCASMFTFGSVFAQWTKPDIKGQEMTLNDTVYLYNVEAGGFLLGANEWNTRASVGTKGYKVIIKESEETGCYWICDSVETQSTVKAMFADNEQSIWVDNLNGANVNTWSITKLENGSYEITNTAIGAFPLGVAEYYQGASGNTRLWLNNPDLTYNKDVDGEEIATPVFSGDFYSQWAFITPSEYERIQPEVALYFAANELKLALSVAKSDYPGADFSSVDAVYNNTSSTIEELNAAKENINSIIAEYKASLASFENPADLTAQIGDGSSIEPWTRQFTGNGQVGTWHLNTWSVEANNGADGTDMVTPFCEDWVASGGILSDQKIFQTLKAAAPGLYKFTANVRAYSEAGKIDSFEGLSMYFGSQSINPQDQTAIYYNNGKSVLWSPNYFNIIAIVTEGGDVEFGFEIKGANFNWLAFKGTSLKYYGNENVEENAAKLYKEAYTYEKASEDLDANSTYIQAYNDAVDVFEAATSTEDILAAVKAADAAKVALNANIDAYKNLLAKLSIYENAYNEGGYNGDKWGLFSDFMQQEEEVEGWPLPTGYDILVNGNYSLTTEEISEYTQTIAALYQQAIASSLEPGVDCTNMLVNANWADAEKGRGWTEVSGQCTNRNLRDGLDAFPVAESWHSLFDYQQTVYDVPDGIYSISLNGFCRLDDGVDTSVPAEIYMNEFATPLQNIADDGVSPDEANDGFNCYLSESSWKNNPLFVENSTDSPAGNSFTDQTTVNADGYYTPSSMTGASIAFSAGRYEVKTYGLVEGGVMKIGVRNYKSTHVWALWSNFKITYEGKTVEAIRAVLSSNIEKMNVYLENNADNLNTKAQGDLNDAITSATDAGKGTNADAMWETLIDVNATFADVKESAVAYAAVMAALEELDVAVKDYYETATPEAQKEYEDVTCVSYDEMSTAELYEYLERVKTAASMLKVPNTEGASIANPIDMTSVITNPTFDTIGDFTGWEGDGFGAGGSTSTCAERYNMNYNTYQDLTGLPAGTYKLTVAGFYRQGSIEDDYYNSMNSDSEDCYYASLYAVSEDKEYKAPIMNLYAGAVDEESAPDYGSYVSDNLVVPNSMAAFTSWKEAGYYLPTLKYNTVIFTVGESGKARIGVKKEELLDTDWSIFDDFTLTYYGTDTISIPTEDEYFVVETFDDWTSDNHGIQSSASSQTWIVNSTGQDKITFDYSVSSESGCDILRVYLTTPSGATTTILEESGSKQGTISRELSAVGNYTIKAEYSKDGSADTSADEGKIMNFCHLMADPITPTKAYLAAIEADYPSFAAELSAAIDAAEAAGDEDKSAAYVQLSNVLGQVRTAVDACRNLEGLLPQAQALVEVLTEEDVDLLAAIAAAETIDVNTSSSADCIEAYTALNDCYKSAAAALVPMDEWAFDTSKEYNVDGLRYYLDKDHAIAQFNGIYGTWANCEFVLPSSITVDGNTYTVVSMENRYQYSQNNITSVVLPNSLRRIGQNAFYCYYNLTSLEIPALVEAVGSYVFSNANNLRYITLKAVTPPTCEGSLSGNSQKRITVPNGTLHAYRLASQWSNCAIVPETPVELSVNVVDAGELGRLVLDEAGYLQEVNKLTVTGELNNDDWASIKNMTNLISIDMSGVLNTSVPDYQFDGKWALEEAVISNKCTSINRYAFQGTGLKEVIIPEGVKSIRDRAFYECRKVASVEMPNSVITVGSEAFGGCYALKNIKLSESMSEISYGMLRYAAIEEIDIPASVTIINEYAFQGCASLTSLVCPSSLKVMHSGVFSDCSSLKDIEFNEGLISIENNTFYNCTALTEVTLPSSLTHCIDKPFYNCRNLKKIYARSIIPAATRGYCPLYNVSLNDVVLYVPSWSVQEYQLADGWNQFMTVEVDDFMPENININKDFTFALRDTLAADYRPNISLVWSDVQSNDSYGNYNYETGNLTINSRSKLPVNDFSLFVSPFKKYYDDYKVVNGWDYGSSYEKYSSTSLIVNGEMRAENVTLNLLARRSTWQFISFPFDVQMCDIVPVDSITQWVIREYSGENRANSKLDSTWINVPSDATLSAGKGYILHCYNPNSDLVQFTVSPLRESVNRQAIFIATDRTIALEENLSEFEQNRSWNLIGNPYPSYYDSRFLDFDAPITVWNTYENNYRAYSPVDDAYILSPGEAFFVQRPVDQEAIVFDKTGRQTHTYTRIIEEEPSQAASRRMAAPAIGHRHVINLNLNGENASDRTRVVLNDAASMDYELSRDASKFMSMDANVPQFFSICNGVRYAINERPVADGEVTLGVIVKKAGVYTITIPEDDMNEYEIVDLLMNTTSVLRADKPFEFTAESGDMESRFILRSISGGDATGVDAIAGGEGEDNAPAFNVAGQAVNKKVADGIIVTQKRKVIK